MLNLSRLIHPTTMGNRFAARVSIVNGVVKQVMSYQPKGAMLDVFSPKVSEQDWLGIPEAERLRSLMPWIITRELLPRRVHNAYWHHEYAMRTYYVDHRWSFVCTALEALVHSNRTGSTAQFVHRVGLLGGGQGITFTEAELVKPTSCVPDSCTEASFYLSELDSPTKNWISITASKIPSGQSCYVPSRIDHSLRISKMRWRSMHSCQCR